MTYLVNLLPSGSLPDGIDKVIFGGNLIALNKKGGGIRPITIGYVFRGIAAKCANTFTLGRIGQALSPIQVGVGTKGGVEAAVHVTRRYLEAISSTRA